MGFGQGRGKLNYHERRWDELSSLVKRDRFTDKLVHKGVYDANELGQSVIASDSKYLTSLKDVAVARLRVQVFG